MLAAAAAADGAAAAALAAQLEGVPEKFQVKGADGKPDLAATLKKLASEGYAPLEKRLGTAGAPPDKPEGYKPDAVLAQLKEKAGGKDVKLPDGMVKEFNAWAHGAGLTQAQYDKALAGYVNGMQNMVDRAFDVAMEKGQAELVKTWGAADGPMFKENMGDALRAWKIFAPKELSTPEEMDKVGSHPVVLRLLAAVGKELREDKRVSGDVPALADEKRTLMNSPAYWNKKHPDHAATVGRVTAIIEAETKAKKAA